MSKLIYYVVLIIFPIVSSATALYDTVDYHPSFGRRYNTDRQRNDEWEDNWDDGWRDSDGKGDLKNKYDDEFYGNSVVANNENSLIDNIVDWNGNNVKTLFVDDIPPSNQYPEDDATRKPKKKSKKNKKKQHPIETIDDASNNIVDIPISEDDIPLVEEVDIKENDLDFKKQNNLINVEFKTEAPRKKKNKNKQQKVIDYVNDTESHIPNENIQTDELPQNENNEVENIWNVEAVQINTNDDKQNLNWDSDENSESGNDASNRSSSDVIKLYNNDTPKYDNSSSEESHDKNDKDSAQVLNKKIVSNESYSSEEESDNRKSDVIKFYNNDISNTHKSISDEDWSNEDKEPAIKSNEKSFNIDSEEEPGIHQSNDVIKFYNNDIFKNGESSSEEGYDSIENKNLPEIPSNDPTELQENERKKKTNYNAKGYPNNGHSFNDNNESNDVSEYYDSEENDTDGIQKLSKKPVENQNDNVDDEYDDAQHEDSQISNEDTSNDTKNSNDIDVEVNPFEQDDEDFKMINAFENETNDDDENLGDDHESNIPYENNNYDYAADETSDNEEEEDEIGFWESIFNFFGK